VTFNDYLVRFLDLYSFKPKKKYVEELLDTSISDDTDIFDDSSEE
jgi:hypothetical protein